MKKLNLWFTKQKLMAEEKFSDYRERIWRLERWFTEKYGSGLTLSVGGGDAPFGDISCDPLTPKHVKCVGEHLPFKPDAFETCLVYSVLDHCLDPVKLLKECKNISKKLLIMQTIIPPQVELIWRIKFLCTKRRIPTLNNIDPYHMRHYTYRKLIKDIENADLKVKRIVMIPERGFGRKILSAMIAFLYVERPCPW